MITSNQLYARRYDGLFVDIGVPEDYASVQAVRFSQRPAVFFDRDGVLNHDSGYVHKIKDFRWIEGAIAAVKRVNDTDAYSFVVTNQAGVAHGFYLENDVRTLHDWVGEQLAPHGAHIDDFRYCPHHPEGTKPGYQLDCPWRKPRSGMIRDLLDCWPIDLERSVLIGDKDSDVAAASSLNIRASKFCGGNLDDFVKNQLNLSNVLS